MTTETELGREVRAAVAKALARFRDNDIAAIKVSDLRKIDALLNPAPEGFEIPIRRDGPAAAQLLVRNARRTHEIDEAVNYSQRVLEPIAANRAAGLREGSAS